MAHLGVFCPNTPGHLNPMTALADALRGRGHRVTFFLVGEPLASVTAAGFEGVAVGGSVFPPDDYREWAERLGNLGGRAGLKHTIAAGVRASEAILSNGPSAVSRAGVDALLVDQASLAGGTVAEELGLPWATVCNALLLHHDPMAPPYFTAWRPRDASWSRLRNRLAWAIMDRLQNPILDVIRARRRKLGLRGPRRNADTWSGRLQISQQPSGFEFPRRSLPEQLHFVGPFRLNDNDPPTPFPWGRLDGRPMIYASLGTLQNRVAGAFRTIAEACHGIDAQLVLSTGRGVAPEALGKLPGEPIVVPYAPQLELLRRSSLAITHAGLNTVLEALGFGVPMVAVPVTNDQPGVAARMAWVGAGEVIPLKQVDAVRLRSLVARVRVEPSYREAAGRVREEIRTSGGAARAAELVERKLAIRA